MAARQYSPHGVPPAIAVDPPGINTCYRVPGPVREGSGADKKSASGREDRGGAGSQNWNSLRSTRTAYLSHRSNGGSQYRSPVGILYVCNYFFGTLICSLPPSAYSEILRREVTKTGSKRGGPRFLRV